MTPQPPHQYFNRDGHAISPTVWITLYEQHSYRLLACTEITDTDDEQRLVLVSTLWQGVDHSLGHAREPVIFETLVTTNDRTEVIDRYSTEAAAYTGHWHHVASESRTFNEPLARDCATCHSP